MTATLFIVLAVGLLTIGVIFYSNKTATDLSDLNSQINLRPLNKFEYISLIVDRQSGNVEREERYETIEEALGALQKIYRRAKVDKVRVNKSSNTEFVTWRAVHNSRGSQEGKKIGGIRIYIERNAEAENVFLNEVVMFSTKSEVDEKLMHYVNAGIVASVNDGDDVGENVRKANNKFYEKYNKDSGEGSWRVSRAEFRYMLSMAHSYLVGKVVLDAKNRGDIKKLNTLNSQKVADDLSVNVVLYWQLLSNEEAMDLRKRLGEIVFEYGLEPDEYPFIKS